MNRRNVSQHCYRRKTCWVCYQQDLVKAGLIFQLYPRIFELVNGRKNCHVIIVSALNVITEEQVQLADIGISACSPSHFTSFKNLIVKTKETIIIRWIITDPFRDQFKLYQVYKTRWKQSCRSCCNYTFNLVIVCVSCTGTFIRPLISSSIYFWFFLSFSLPRDSFFLALPWEWTRWEF